MTIKVLAVTPLFLPYLGGIEVLVDALSRGLRRFDIETVVMTDSGKNPSYSDVVNGTRVHRYPMSKAIMSRGAGEPLRVLHEIGPMLAEERPDIIHLHSAAQAGVFFIDRLLRRLPAPPPVVITQHGLLAEADRLDVTRRLLADAAFVTGVSEAALRSAHEFSGRTGPSRMIFNGIEAPPQPQTERTMPDRHQLLCVGRIAHEKGFDRAIEALVMIRAGGVDADLSVIGGGDEQPALAGLAADLGVSAHVHFLGPKTNQQTRAAMAEASVLLVPSRLREGFGLVAAEAAFVGTPCIACRTGGLAEVILEGETGYLVDEEDAKALASVTASLLQDEPRWNRLSATARLGAPARFDINACVAKYAALLQTLK